MILKVGNIESYRMDITKFHLVYRITNKVNGKYYIGVHSTYNISDGYMGSGSLLKREIKQFGLECFDREILFSLKTRDEALLKEAELVTYDVLNDSMNYNLVLGGANGLKTVKFKRSLFYSNPTPLKISKEIPFEKFDSNYRYKVRIDKAFMYLGKAPLYEVLYSPTIFEIIETQYNNRFTNDLGVKYLELLQRLPGYKNNVYLEKSEW